MSIKNIESPKMLILNGVISIIERIIIQLISGPLKLNKIIETYTIMIPISINKQPVISFFLRISFKFLFLAMLDHPSLFRNTNLFIYFSAINFNNLLHRNISFFEGYTNTIFKILKAFANQFFHLITKSELSDKYGSFSHSIGKPFFMCG